MQTSDERIAEIEAADGVGATRERTMIGKGKNDDRVNEGRMKIEMLVHRCKDNYPETKTLVIIHTIQRHD